MLVTKWLCENLLKVLGWTVDKTNPPVSNCVVIAAPHTSNWDFILMLLFAGAFGQKINWMGKSNLFIKPFGYLLRQIGGISVNRSQKNQIVGNMISLFKTRENFLLVVPVEGLPFTQLLLNWGKIWIEIKNKKKMNLCSPTVYVNLISR